MPIRYAALLALLAALLLADCKPRQDRAQAGAAVARTPTLWEAAALDPAGRPQASLRICADERIQVAFARPAPQVGDQVCGATEVLQERPDAYSATCRIGEQAFSVNAVVLGDRSRDATVEITVQRLPNGPVFQQVRRYRKVAEACPPGWTAGAASSPERPGPYASAPGEASNARVPGKS